MAGRGHTPIRPLSKTRGEDNQRPPIPPWSRPAQVATFRADEIGSKPEPGPDPFNRSGHPFETPFDIERALGPWPGPRIKEQDRR